MPTLPSALTSMAPALALTLNDLAASKLRGGRVDDEEGRVHEACVVTVVDQVRQHLRGAVSRRFEVLVADRQLDQLEIAFPQVLERGGRGDLEDAGDVDVGHEVGLGPSRISRFRW